MWQREERKLLLDRGPVRLDVRGQHQTLAKMFGGLMHGEATCATVVRMILYATNVN